MISRWGFNFIQGNSSSDIMMAFWWLHNRIAFVDKRAFSMVRLTRKCFIGSGLVEYNYIPFSDQAFHRRTLCKHIEKQKY